jgi:hypothetical protein
MNFKEFIEKYKPIIIDSQLTGYKCFLASKWPDTRIMLKKENTHIWSVLKEEGKIILKNDLHFKGLLGNIVTEIPFEDKNLIIEIE